ncbi:glutamic acid-rich protein-like [Papaver somniferum]|uniref:glutamic acid-rich protein-like n=1 Tax=Papaver somniferum TaxID=3469 RepID=UPI000E6F6021|nr:glutamic acid-rich protein-like [Papaver somniferum]
MHLQVMRISLLKLWRKPKTPDAVETESRTEEIFAPPSYENIAAKAVEDTETPFFVETEPRTEETVPEEDAAMTIEVSQGVAPPCNYIINGHQYKMSYFLADGIYPKLTTIVQALSQILEVPEIVRTKKYQMVKRKDVERALGALQETTDNHRFFMSSLKSLEMHLQLKTDFMTHIVVYPRRGDQAQPGAQTVDSSSLECSDKEYVVLPSSGGEHEDTSLDEEVVHGQNEDGVFDYYREYNDEIPDDFEHAREHAFENGYEHDGDEDDDDDDEDDDENDEYDDEDEEDE